MPIQTQHLVMGFVIRQLKGPPQMSENEVAQLKQGSNPARGSRGEIQSEKKNSSQQVGSNANQDADLPQQ